MPDAIGARAWARNLPERNRLLVEQLPQVHSIARKTHARLPGFIAVEDLVHAGVLGLIDALAKYDPARNTKFKAYASFRIYGAMIDSLRQMDWASRNLRRQARSLDQARTRLAARLGRAANESELAGECGMEMNRLQRLLTDLRAVELAHLPCEPDDDVGRADAAGCASTEQDRYELCLRAELRELLCRAIERMPPKERRVIRMYYLQEWTMKRVGRALGVGESRVSQIHSTALRRLRATFEGARQGLKRRVHSADVIHSAGPGERQLGCPEQGPGPANPDGAMRPEGQQPAPHPWSLPSRSALPCGA